MSLTIREQKLIRKFATQLVEARDDAFAEYEIKKDKVIAYVSKQKGSAFTKLAEEWAKFEKLESILAEKKRALNVELQAAKNTEDELKNKVREKVISIFDESEQAMSLAVNCLNSSFTVSQLTEENRDKIIARTGDFIDTDYKKVLDLLLEQMPDLQQTVAVLIKQCSTIAVEDIMKPGAKRRVRITTKTESYIAEGVWDNIVSIFNKLVNKFKQLIGRGKKRQYQIDLLISRLENRRKALA